MQNTINVAGCRHERNYLFEWLTEMTVSVGEKIREHFMRKKARELLILPNSRKLYITTETSELAQIYYLSFLLFYISFTAYFWILCPV